MAASWAAARLGTPVAHVEASLRRFDRSMPEQNQQGFQRCSGQPVVYYRGGRRSLDYYNYPLCRARELHTLASEVIAALERL
ncbi:MAG TPA: hypothetical protein VEW05_05235 [Candidatus Polarisedimenticolia bacterium]|nr:hypothetical protein [Candidatus Polarisedimenticolia bacterium]